MSIFASRTLTTIPIPFDPPHEVTIQKLPGRHLQAAADAFLASLVSGMQQRGGAAVQKDIQTLFATDEAGATAAVEKVKADPLNGYDPPTLIKHGVKGWTYDVPADVAAFDDLDERAVDFLAREILRLTKPALFETKDEQETARKNG